MKVVPTPGTHPIVHTPAPRKAQSATGDIRSRENAVDLSRIRTLGKGMIGVSPTEMDQASHLIQGTRETAESREESPERQLRFKQVFNVLTRRMGITPPLATEIANTILFVPRPQSTGRDEEIEVEGAEAEGTEAEGIAADETAPGGSEEESGARTDPVEQVLYKKFVSKNPVLRRLTAETRTNREGDGIKMTGAGDLESDLMSQEDVLLKMEAVAREIHLSPFMGNEAETGSVVKA